MAKYGITCTSIMVAGCGVLCVASLATAQLPQSSSQLAVDLGWTRVPAGTFRMGCVEGDRGCLDTERPRHEVRFLKPFDLMEAEVTVAQYLQFVRETGYAPPPGPDFGQTDDHPIVLVNWDDAVAFCHAAGARLPTEAEWEYGARGGIDGLVFGWEDQLSRNRANYGSDQCCAGAIGEADEWVNTAPVKSFPPNDFGLYDMVGNVWEWVGGWLDDDYYDQSPSIDPPGASAGYARIARGGSWLNFPSALRTSVRLPFAQTGQTSNVGIRCARDVTVSVAE